MTKPIERELKILISEEIYEKILRSYDFDEKIDQTNIYFDTPDHFVEKNKMAVRIRTKHGRSIFTLKKRNDSTSHIELEKEISSSLENIEDEEVLGWLKEYNVPLERLEPVQVIHTIRHLKKLDHAELCLDFSEFNEASDYELEYEYTSIHDGLREFNKIIAPFGLTYEKNCPSKIARAAAARS